jgi:hypothetical protein
VDISESLRFVASREAASGSDSEADKESKIPITPVTSYEKMLPKFQKQTTNVNQHTSYDFRFRPWQCNGMIWLIQSGLVVKMKSGAPYFEKSANLLARYYKTYLRLENQKKTMRQAESVNSKIKKVSRRLALSRLDYLRYGQGLRIVHASTRLRSR